jgi:uncharacterized membrane protein YdjX (TVP38/TMEM64 family)
VVNLAAGAAQVRLRDFMLGTFLGMSPGIVAVTVFWGQVLAALRQPSPWSLMVLGLVAAAIVFGAAVLRRWLTRRTAAKAIAGAQAPPASAAK